MTNLKLAFASRRNAWLRSVRRANEAQVAYREAKFICWDRFRTRNRGEDGMTEWRLSVLYKKIMLALYRKEKALRDGNEKRFKAWLDANCRNHELLAQSCARGSFQRAVLRGEDSSQRLQGAAKEWRAHYWHSENHLVQRLRDKGYQVFRMGDEIWVL